MKNKRQRARIDAPTQGLYKFRTTIEDRAIMKYLEDNTGMTKSDILRKGMKLMFYNVRYKNGKDI